MNEQALDQPEVSQVALWFSLLGGGGAWLVHLLAVYTISEWGCVQWSPRFEWLGITVTAWLLIVTSIATLFVAVWAAWAGYRSERDLPDGEDEETAGAPEQRWGRFAARTGLLMSGLFAFIILVESIPTFYFLQNCGGLP